MADSNFKSDCYSEGERGWMEYGQRLRAVLLGPLLKLLTTLRIGPDTITLVSGAFGLAFVPLWLTHLKSWAIASIFTHILLDGLDGPVARHQNLASPRGSFTDTCTDQFVVTAVMTAWMIQSPEPFHIAAGSTYIFLYAFVVAVAMIRNALSIPYSWLIRPRLFVFTALAFDHWQPGYQLTLFTLLICNVLLLTKSISGFYHLRRQLPGPEQLVPDKLTGSAGTESIRDSR